MIHLPSLRFFSESPGFAAQAGYKCLYPAFRPRSGSFRRFALALFPSVFADQGNGRKKMDALLHYRLIVWKIVAITHFCDEFTHLFVVCPSTQNICACAEQTAPASIAAAKILLVFILFLSVVFEI